MMPKNLRLMFLLHSRTRVHKYRVKKAKERVGEWLSMVDSPYVAFSTGKDSTVALHLVRGIKPDVPYVYFDAGVIYPESLELLNSLPSGIIFATKKTRLEVIVEDGFDSSWRKYRVDAIQRCIKKHNFDGCCYGLRQEESYGRRMNAMVMGSVFHMKRDDVIMCQPVHDWKRDDIWAYIVSNNVPYCGYYDHLWHLPEEDQRLSYWVGSTKTSLGRYSVLKSTYPEMYNEVISILPEVANYT